MTIIKTWSLEWRERGKWIKSASSFKSPRKAKKHADIIGAFGIIRIRPIKKNKEIK